MWIYEYRKFDLPDFLPVGPYDSREEAAEAMRDYAEQFGVIVQGPKEIAGPESMPTTAGKFPVLK